MENTFSKSADFFDEHDLRLFPDKPKKEHVKIIFQSLNDVTLLVGNSYWEVIVKQNGIHLKYIQKSLQSFSREDSVHHLIYIKLPKSFCFAAKRIVFIAIQRY